MSSGIWRQLSRNCVKVSLAAEREPLPVGIGEGGGAWVVDRLAWRMAAMAA